MHLRAGRPTAGSWLPQPTRPAQQVTLIEQKFSFKFSSCLYYCTYYLEVFMQSHTCRQVMGWNMTGRKLHHWVTSRWHFYQSTDIERVDMTVNRRPFLSRYTLEISATVFDRTFFFSVNKNIHKYISCFSVVIIVHIYNHYNNELMTIKFFDVLCILLLVLSVFSLTHGTPLKLLDLQRHIRSCDGKAHISSKSTITTLSHHSYRRTGAAACTKAFTRYFPYHRPDLLDLLPSVTVTTYVMVVPRFPTFF